MSAALADAKRAFYRDEGVAAGYDQQRFGGASGAYVNNREIAVVAGLLPASLASVADVGAGTGRLLPLLRERSDRVLALDASLAMLQQVPRPPQWERLGEGPLLVQADAFALPLASGGLEGATCLRLLFHLQEPAPVLRELRRIVQRGGVLVCDSATWSPRGLLPLGRGAWGERVSAMGRQAFRALAQEAGWRVAAEQACFLISPYTYRRLPLPLARLLERLEAHLPEQWRCRMFWRLEAA